jgi:serine/threonine-protein kinase RsbW
VDLGLEADVRRERARSLAELGPLFERLEGWMTVLGYPRKDIFAVRLALREAAVNAFRHGNRGDPAKHVRVSYLVRDHEVVLEVADEGRGFNPALVSDPVAESNAGRPAGRGLFLMRVYMNWVSFNPAGNRVTLCRLRSAL